MLKRYTVASDPGRYIDATEWQTIAMIHHDSCVRYSGIKSQILYWQTRRAIAAQRARHAMGIRPEHYDNQEQ